MKLTARFLMACMLCGIWINAVQADPKNSIPADITSAPSIFGSVEIDNPLIKSLLNAPIMKRLRGVDQTGPSRYFSKLPAFSRYAHSIGVYALLRKYNVPFEEQIAGLLHDSSHTVFSHLADVLFKSSNESYQDDIFVWYLSKMGVNKILEPYGLDIAKVSPKRTEFKALEQELPSICADRIEYNLHTALLFGLISKREIKHIMRDLRYENKQWYFVNQASAQKFSKISLHFTENLWGSASNVAISHWSSEVIKRALELKIISIHEFHFGVDQKILDKLYRSQNPKIRRLLKYCRNDANYFEVVQGAECDLHFKPKFRGVDPYVLVKGKLHRLTTVNKNYNREYRRVKAKMKEGIKIRFKEDEFAKIAMITSKVLAPQ
jgi:HD superfamily phosphohydrolase